jgi:hypothetical protein
METVANRDGFRHKGRLKLALERWTNPKPSRRACSPRYGLPSCGEKSAGVGLISHPKPLNVTIRTCWHCCATGEACCCGEGGEDEGRQVARTEQDHGDAQDGAAALGVQRKAPAC